MIQSPPQVEVEMPQIEMMRDDVEGMATEKGPKEEEKNTWSESDDTPLSTTSSEPVGIDEGANTDCSPCCTTLPILFIISAILSFGSLVPIGYYFDSFFSVNHYHFHIYYMAYLAAAITITITTRVAVGPRVGGASRVIYKKTLEIVIYLCFIIYLQWFVFNSPVASASANQLVEQKQSMLFEKNNNVKA